MPINNGSAARRPLSFGERVAAIAEFAQSNIETFEASSRGQALKAALVSFHQVGDPSDEDVYAFINNWLIDHPQSLFR